MKLAERAILAGVHDDLLSGSNVDLCVISDTLTEFIRPSVAVCKKDEQ